MKSTKLLSKASSCEILLHEFLNILLCWSNIEMMAKTRMRRKSFACMMTWQPKKARNTKKTFSLKLDKKKVASSLKKQKKLRIVNNSTPWVECNFGSYQRQLNKHKETNIAENCHKKTNLLEMCPLLFSFKITILHIYVYIYNTH